MSTFEQQLKNALSNAYDIERELGGGGMSRVYVATDRLLGRKIVIKLLSPELTAEVNRGRFRREIQVAAQLQHPHIVTLLSAGEDGDIVYYTMPFIKGESLKSALEKDGAMSVSEVLRILYDVVDAIGYAHENGVVHRDIKPANILRSGAHSLVTDFGVAKALNAAMPSGGMTSTGMAIGTPAYMAPEQLAGEPTADHRIDIYAVGLLAYELLVGKSPFAAESPRAVLAAVLSRDPQPLHEARPDVPRPLSDMVMSCLAKEKEMRPSSANELLSALQMFSMSSGEIRTHEHVVPRLATTGQATPTTPSWAVPAVSASTPSGSTPAVTADDASSGISSGGTVLIEGASLVPDATPPDLAPTYEPSGPKKSRNKLVLGVVTLLVAAIAIAFLLSQRGGSAAPVVVTPPAPVSPVVTDTTLPPQTAPGAILPGAPGATGVVAVSDSQARADSVKAKAARVAKAKADSLKKLAAAAKADSAKAKPAANAAEPTRIVRSARWAAGAMLADANARAAFEKGASKSRKKGDLQTQIDALQPFLARYALTYDGFKQIVKDAGFNIFDQFGRMIPSEMQRFAASQ
ncbi:MAG TPA: serine/threonine-protein kinase [Gemmatimonadaceae bacterium]|jgi:serine/threonine protein kinase|nr:serine/threonine-protein kinase [Gemmatimonadaceae bacterium]